jgi:hypothetical protein
VQYRESLNEEQRSQAGCSAGRMQLEFHHGLPAKLRLKPPRKSEELAGAASLAVIALRAEF